MAIRIACFGLPVTGPTRLTVELGPNMQITLRELIERHLAPRFEGDLLGTLVDGEELAPNWVVLINGRNALGLGGLDATLDGDAQVLISPPVGGG